MQNARRNQLQDELLVADLHRVAGIMPALVADHNVEMSAKKVDDLALALVAPLRAQYDYVTHDPNPIIVTRPHDPPRASLNRLRFHARLIPADTKKDFSTAETKGRRKIQSSKHSVVSAATPLCASQERVFAFLGVSRVSAVKIFFLCYAAIMQLCEVYQKLERKVSINWYAAFPWES